MLYALKNEIIISASQGIKASCPLCNEQVFSINKDSVSYWSHISPSSCDPWIEPETKWSNSWKTIFCSANSEKVLGEDGLKHFADIHTSAKITIKLLNFPVNHHPIPDMESFFGERMLWLINGQDLNKDIISIEGNASAIKLPAFWRINSWLSFKRPIFIDTHNGELLYFSSGEEVKRSNGKIVNRERFITKYKI